MQQRPYGQALPERVYGQRGHDRDRGDQHHGRALKEPVDAQRRRCTGPARRAGIPAAGAADPFGQRGQ